MNALVGQNGRPIDHRLAAPRTTMVRIMHFKSLSLLLLLFLLPVSLSAQSAKDKVWLGVSVEEADKGGAVTLVEVVPASPAAKAGLKVGDRILQVGRSKIKDLDGFMETVLAMTPGSTQAFAVQRKGKRLNLRVRLGSQAERIAIASGKKLPARTANQGKMAKPIRPKGKGRLGVTLEEDGTGIRIVDVDKGGPGAKAGLQKGDVLVKAGGRDAKDLDQVIASIQKSGAGSRYPMVVRRRGKNKSVAARLGGFGNQPAEPGRMAPPAVVKKRTPAPKKKTKTARQPVQISKVVKQAKTSGRLALILFFDPESPASKLTSKSLADPAVSKILRGGYVGTHINVLTQAKVADRYGVMATPHFVVLNGDGKTVGRFTGYQMPARLAARLKRYLDANRKSTPVAAKPTSRPMAAGQPRAVEAQPSRASQLERNQQVLRQMQAERRRMEKLLQQMQAMEKRLKKLKGGK